MFLALYFYLYKQLKKQWLPLYYRYGPFLETGTPFQTSLIKHSSINSQKIAVFLEGISIKSRSFDRLEVAFEFSVHKLLCNVANSGEKCENAFLKRIHIWSLIPASMLVKFLCKFVMLDLIILLTKCVNIIYLVVFFQELWHFQKEAKHAVGTMLIGGGYIDIA